MPETPATRPRRRAAPLAAVDGVTLVGDTEVTAVKAVHAADPYLDGHYPEFTIYPGVFIMESVNQAVDEFVARRFGAGRIADLTTVKSVRFTTPVLPGDTLQVSCTILADGDALAVNASCRNSAGATAAKLRLSYGVVDGGGR
ncbi:MULTISPECIES: 3-hydroxyacyl-ACP dehydratase FabZ family protein [unclassified Kitasatospora]|uniref:3-hydroxyacyl-ACP dehydratase FabZ family protein n=1 Tax=unclassified Kitasatospora TaxID=2633591 RepID=UPI001ADF6F62|nr:MaoC/PaaZ C-terminal domain-containing protein [Kitasatospora sp. RG8]MBP0450819.1 hypothetical protein [Kitasatospora sp. RG8]